MTAATTQVHDVPEVRRAALDRLADWSMRPSAPGLRWGFALVVGVIAVVLRLLLDPLLPPGYPFLTFFPAVAFTALLAGTLPGAGLAVVLLLVAWYRFIPPVGSFALDGPAAVALLLFLIVTLTEVGLVHLMRRALRRLARAEARAQEIARTRTLMFAELQHRVSNNLAVVGSLLQLQGRGVADPAAAHALEAAAARVNVVARLNRLLHNPAAQSLDFGAFLRAAVPDVVDAAGATGRVEVVVRAEPVHVSADRAVPLGLVTTELLANAIEHGFAKERRGRVEVVLERKGPGMARLVIRDNGAGLPEGFDLARARSLGLTIARQFAEQLGATLTIRDEGGCVSCLEVPVED